MIRSNVLRGIAALLVITVMLAGSTRSAQTATPDVIHVGRAVNTAFAFATFEVGNDAHIWDSVGIKLAVTSFNGDGQLQHGHDGGAVDFGLGVARRWATTRKASRRPPSPRCTARRTTWRYRLRTKGSVKSVDRSQREKGRRDHRRLVDGLARPPNVDQGRLGTRRDPLAPDGCNANAHRRDAIRSNRGDGSRHRHRLPTRSRRQGQSLPDVR